MGELLKITEAEAAQFPMVRHAAEIGWTAIPPDVARQKRGGLAGMFFRDELESRLADFNPWMSTDAIRQVVERLEALPPTIEGNREMLGWLRGERQWYDEAEARQRRVQLIDFDSPGANILHVTWEWRLKPPARKGNRADVMFVVNGVPVAIVEHKNPQRRQRHRTGRQAAQALREGDSRASRLAAALQRHPRSRLLVRRDLERQPALHGALEAATRGDLQVRRSVVLRAYRFSAHSSRTGFCSTLRTARRESQFCDSISAVPSTGSSSAAPSLPGGAD